MDVPPKVEYLSHSLLDAYANGVIPIPDLYIYEATMHPSDRYPIGVLDGDTVELNVDFGMRSGRTGLRIRLYAIDAAEVRGDERKHGISAKHALEHLISTCIGDAPFFLRTHKDKKTFDRYVGELWTLDKMLCLNWAMMHRYGGDCVRWDLNNI